MIRTLIIDDSKSVHAFMKDCLTADLFTLHHAYDGVQGVAESVRLKDQIDLILLDWEMPGLTGPEACRKIIDSGVNVPIIMVTTKNDLADIQKMLTMGVKEYIMKPFTKDIIFDKIRDVLSVELPEVN